MNESLLPSTGRQCFFYIVNDIGHLESVANDSETWWCVAAANAPGDFGVIYVTGVGIRFVFEFIAFVPRREFCVRWRMATARVKIVAIVTPPKTAKELKESPELKQLRAVRRSFQGRWFEVENDLQLSLLEFVGVSSGG